MNFHPYTQATALEGSRQTIAQGPVAALEIIKNLGTNGGGFFNANGAHPLREPDAAGELHRDAGHRGPPGRLHPHLRIDGRTGRGMAGCYYRVMVFLFVVGLLICGWAEQHGNPLLPHALNARASAAQAGGNMEGKEVRFGITSSVLTAVTTSNGATGSYNSMHDSYTPIGGMVPLINMLLGEMVFGGLGTGLYSIIMIALVALFLAGLMIGRTPAFLGKKDSRGRKQDDHAVHSCRFDLHPAVHRAGGADQGRARRPGDQHRHARLHGDSVSPMPPPTPTTGRTLPDSTPIAFFYNLTTAITMMLGRFGLAIPALGLAGMFAAQQPAPDSAGTLPTNSLSFAVLLTFNSADCLGSQLFSRLGTGADCWST